MIIYGVCAGSIGKYEEIARPSIDRVSTPDDEVHVLMDQTSIFEAYNEILERARERPTLEAVVLLHDDVEIDDDLIRSKLQAVFADGDVSIAGVIGAKGVRSLAWWDYVKHGKVTEDRLGVIDCGAGTHEVDMVDGLFLALSPWAVHNLSFDAHAYRGFHGYDGDLCFTARSLGRKVVVTDVDVIHHTQGGYGNRDVFKEADRTFRRKWGLREPVRLRLRRHLRSARHITRRL